MTRPSPTQGTDLNGEQMALDKHRVGKLLGGILLEDSLVEGNPEGDNPVEEEGMPQEVEGTVQEDTGREDIQGIHVHGVQTALYHARHLYPSHHPFSSSSSVNN